jgi:phospholipid transport system transporter-binding protein
MSPLSIVNESPGRFLVEGNLTFSAMNKKTVSDFAFLTTNKQITLDFSKVDNADSAGLALMLEWIKQASGKRVQLRFINIPGQILNLAMLCGLDKTSYFSSGKSDSQADTEIA